MKKFMGKILGGRYGFDRYNIFLVCVGALLMAIGAVANNVAGTVLMMIAVAFIIKAYVRLMSKKPEKRSEENKKYIRARKSFVGTFKIFFRLFREGKWYKFFKCPGCAEILRLPKNKGNIEITCPCCGKKFIGRT